MTLRLPKSTADTVFPALQRLNNFLTTHPCAGATEELEFSLFLCSKSCNPSPTSCLHSSSVYMLPV